MPAAITGAVGLAGIGGTLLSVKIRSKFDAASLRTSIAVEDARTRLGEKRRIYVNCLASLLAAIEPRFPQEPSAAAARNQASIAAANAIFQVRLIAPQEVSARSDRFLRLIARFEGGQEESGQFTKWHKELSDAMRADTDAEQARIGSFMSPDAAS